MAPEQDGDRGRRGRRRQLAEPRIGDVLGEQKVGREAVLCRGPAGLLSSDPMGKKDPAVDDRRVREPGEMVAERSRTVAVEQEPEDRSGWPVGTPRRGRLVLRQARRRAKASLLDPRPRSCRRVQLEPCQGSGRGPTGDQQLGARVGCDGAERRDPRSEQREVGGAACPTGADEDEVEGSVDVDREPPAPAQVVDLEARHFVEPARQRVVAGKVRDRGQRLDSGDRHHVGRVAIVGECPARLSGSHGDERLPVVCRGQRDRPGAEDDKSAALDVGYEFTESIAEGPIVRWATDDLHVLGAGCDEPAAVMFGERRPGVRDPARQGSGPRIRRWMEDSNGDRRHRSSLAGAASPSGLPQPDTGGVSERTVRAYVGLGANVGDAEATLTEAVRALAALRGTRLRGVSRLYATEPVGVTDQPEFRNAVVALDVPALPDPERGSIALLSALKALERDFGRRTRERWGPRELDLDLLVFGRARVNIERPPAARSIDADSDPAKAAKVLEVPHPAAQSRLFVLAPLADLAPRLVPPGWGETVETARRRQELVEDPSAVRAIGAWDAGRRRWRTGHALTRRTPQPR